MIIGAGGSIGTFSIQLAKHFGANVTGVDSTDKLDLMRALGADRVIDYTTEDYTKNDEKYDLIIDVVGKRGVLQRLKLLKPGGDYFLAYAGLSHLFLKMWTSTTSKKKLRIEASSQNKADLIFLKELLEAGKVRSIIDRSYPLEQAADAHRYAESGRKQGNVAITIP